MTARRVLIIPAYEEEANIGRVLAAAREHAPAFELVVVDDGSSDTTAAIATAAGATVLRHPFNLGYGAALQSGYKYALETGAELLVQMDGDNQHDARDIPALIAPIVDDECDVVVGSRFAADTGYEMSALRRLGRNVFSALARLAGLHVTDPTSGFQAISRRALEVYARDFFPMDYPDVNVLLAAYWRGLRVGERPVTMRAEVRASRMHGGWRSIAYVYKMMLSTWSASARMRSGR